MMASSILKFHIQSLHQEKYEQGYTLIETLIVFFIVALLLSIAIPTFATVIQNILPNCKEDACIGLDPKTEKCDRTARTVAINFVNDGYIELRQSAFCKASWARAKVPVGSMIYVEDSSRKVYGRYVIQPIGVMPQYSDMGYGSFLRACARLRTGQVVCTN